MKQSLQQWVRPLTIWTILAVLILLLVACATGRPDEIAPEPIAVATATSPTTAPLVTESQSPEPATTDSTTPLRYQGPAEMGSPDPSQCATLVLGETGVAQVGACDGTTRDLTIGERAALEWEQLRNRFAPFVYETATETLTFNGSGDVTGEQWQRALLAWARARHAELASGSTSATINTALRWHLGQDYTQKNICTHLTVLDYGYAYAEEILCEGSDVVSTTGDWLTDEELAQFDAWLYTHAPFYNDPNYIDGKGAQEMDEAEVAAIHEWATDLWSRIKSTGHAAALGTTTNSCPDAQDGLGMVRNYQRGFCLLVPGSYTVFDTGPNEIAIVQESLLNVTDPRLHIAVSAAEGRRVEQVADALVTELAGFELARSTATIAGQPAIVLDNVPGQDINRRVLIVNNDQLYDLTFTPMSSAEMETFYATIVEHFVLVTPEEPLGN
ncbi:MAG: hypothetical protein R2867_27505 [Caldilineaceae bacterium]